MDEAQDVLTEELTRPVRDPGSFRDPTGFVCHYDDGIYRAVDRPFLSLMQDLEGSGLLRRLQRGGALVPTRIVGRHEPVYAELRRHVPQVEAFLQHEKIPFISYPSEWSRAMLGDAATRCLDLQRLLMEQGYSLKDASAYNVQFRSACPQFIDVPSIETVPRRDVWSALHQFYRMFLYPLLLEAYGRGSIREYFLAHLDGMELDDVYARLGGWRCVRPATLLDIWLPYHLQRVATRRTGAMQSRLQREHADARALEFNLKRLRRKVQALSRRAPRATHWVHYADDNSYEEQAAAVKMTFVERFLSEACPRRVLDVGCNTGRFSELAAQRGAAVVAVDPDAGCIDALYRRVRERGLNVLPLVVDIANPTPGIGFRHVERSPFLERASFDSVFALALIHHLVVTARLPMESVRDLFAQLTERHLLAEFVAPQDPMFRSLVAAREDIYQHLTLEGFLMVFGHRFDIVRTVSVGEHRTLVHFVKR